MKNFLEILMMVDCRWERGFASHLYVESYVNESFSLDLWTNGPIDA